ncbi:MAG: CCA tRNA nucleotidyltransferase [Vampirovibrionia bacterium]
MNLNYNDKVSQFVLKDAITQTLNSFCSSYKDIELYIVGGYLRDLLIDRETDDRDYVIIGESANIFAEKLAHYLDGYYVELDKDNDIARVVLPDKQDYIDIAACVGNSIEEDLSRRDFTINAMAFNIDNTSDKGIIDLYNGQSDLANRCLKVISYKNIIDDPLRILRGFRLASLLNAEIDNDTYNYIVENRALLNNVAFERINTEFNKLFNQNDSFKFVEKMAKSGVLEVVIPELSLQHNVPSNVYHHLGLYDHTLEVYNQLEKVIKIVSDTTLSHLQEYITPSTKRIVALKYAALLHDIAKPATWKIDENNKHSFIGHPEEGSVMAEEICQKLKLPSNVTKAVVKLVKYHLYPSQLSNTDEKPTVKAMNRFYRKIDDSVPELILLAIADRKAAVGPLITEEILNNNIETLEYILENYYIAREKQEAMPKLVNGKDVMSILGISPSVRVGEILDEIRELQIEEHLITKEDAILWLKDQL